MPKTTLSGACNTAGGQRRFWRAQVPARSRDPGTEGHSHTRCYQKVLHYLNR